MLTNDICNFFNMDGILVGKVTISASLRKIYFPTILEQAPLTNYEVFVISVHLPHMSVSSDQQKFGLY